MSNELISIEGHTGITAVGWDLTGVTEDQWSSAGEVLVKINKASQWWMGDWWNACSWGDGAKIAEDIGINPRTAKDYGITCRKIEIGRRFANLSFSHHTQVCRLATKKLQDDFLRKSSEKGWTAQQLRAEIDKFKKFDDWDESELDRKALVEGGITVVANSNDGDEHLIQWAKDNKKYVFVGRSMHDIGWGNPYELDKDGDRDTVCDSHEHYFERKYGLHDKVAKLKGKVLGCYCYPARCHGDYLARIANEVE